MDDDERTIFCGNLSEKVTEDILYELFLQGGPIEKVSIPKDRDGKQRSYGFITYKHVNSVGYALKLFEGITLYDRYISMKPRHNTEPQQLERSLSQGHYINTRLQQNQQIAMRNLPMLINSGIMLDAISSPYNQLDANSSKNDRNNKRIHPYQKDKNKSREKDKVRDKDRDKNRSRERNREYINHNDHFRDEKQHYNRDDNHRSDHSRYSGNRKRWSY